MKHIKTIIPSHGQFKCYSLNPINLKMKEDEFIGQWEKLENNRKLYDKSYYQLYLYLVNEDGTQFEFPKPDYKVGDFSKLHITLGIPTIRNHARELRRMATKLLLILNQKIQENQENPNYLLHINNLANNNVIKNMMQKEQDEKEEYTTQGSSSLLCLMDKIADELF